MPEQSINTMEAGHEVVHLKELHALVLLVIILIPHFIITVFRVSESRGWRFLHKSGKPLPFLLNSDKVWGQVLLLGRALYQGFCGRRQLVDKLELGEDGDAPGGEAGANQTHLTKLNNIKTENKKEEKLSQTNEGSLKFGNRDANEDWALSKSWGPRT